MIFKYEETEIVDGFYIVEIFVGGKTERCVAEYYSDTWMQTGIEYDIWQYTKEFQNAEIKVIAKIHLDDCTITEM